MNKRLIIKHGWYLLKRKVRVSILQAMPSFLLTLMTLIFSKTYLINSQSISAYYFNILILYLVLTFLICLFVSVVIFYKETNLEITTLNYLYWVGLSKKKINLVILSKWLFIVLAGIVVSQLFFLIYEFAFEGISFNGKFLYIFLIATFVNILLFPGILIALILNKPLNELKRQYDNNS